MAIEPTTTPTTIPAIAPPDSALLPEEFLPEVPAFEVAEGVTRVVAVTKTVDSPLLLSVTTDSDEVTSTVVWTWEEVVEAVVEEVVEEEDDEDVVDVEEED